jgi:hypothetical protein
MLYTYVNGEEEHKVMKWLEVIKVQASSGHEITARNEFMSLVSDIRQNPDYPGLLGFVIYRHALVPGYFSIHLLWDSQHPQTRGSVAGLNLAQTLKTFGLVDHSVWMETI